MVINESGFIKEVKQIYKWFKFDYIVESRLIEIIPKDVDYIPVLSIYLIKFKFPE